MSEKTNKLLIIKSTFILKRLFSLLVAIKKLDLIIYNKILQRKLLIGIDDYKKESGKIIIGKRNRLGKEYNYKNELIFEDEYTNGKRNGKGKKYEFGKLIFKGNYLNGKVLNGFGFNKENNVTLIIYSDNNVIELFDNLKIKFCGIYNNGRRWNGISFNYDGKEEFEIKYGKGKIKEYYANGLLKFELKFEGEYLNRERNGNLILYYDNGKLRFIGGYLNGERNGKGKLYKFGVLKFEGEYINGKWNGKGKEYNENNELIFEGEYLNGVKNGFGKEYYYDLYFYKRPYMNRKKYRCFLGNLIYKHKRYNNDYLNLIESGHRIFEGIYKNGIKWNGKGKEYYDNGRLKFEGEYLNGKRNGRGKEYYCKYKNLKFEGQYLNGKRHGIGKEYKYGKLIFEGQYFFGLAI